MKKILKVLVLVLICTGFTIGSLYAKQGWTGSEVNHDFMYDHYIDDGYTGEGTKEETKEETVEQEDKPGYEKISYTNMISDFDATLSNAKDLYMVGDELTLEGPRDVIEKIEYYKEITKPEPIVPEPEVDSTTDPDNHECHPRRVAFIDNNGHQFFCIWDHDFYAPHEGNPCKQCKWNNPNWQNPHLGS